MLRYGHSAKYSPLSGANESRRSRAHPRDGRSRKPSAWQVCLDDFLAANLRSPGELQDLLGCIDSDLKTARDRWDHYGSIGNSAKDIVSNPEVVSLGERVLGGRGSRTTPEGYVWHFMSLILWIMSLDRAS